MPVRGVGAVDSPLCKVRGLRYEEEARQAPGLKSEGRHVIMSEMNDSDQPVDARTAEIAAGAEKPGWEGAYWRYIKRLDVPNDVIKWLAGEQLRGTPPVEVALAMASLVADVVCAVSQNMARNDMRPFAQRVMRTAVDGDADAGLIGVHEFLEHLLTLKKAGALRHTGIHLVKE